MEVRKFFSKAATRHYALPKEAVDAFMALPPKRRIAIWGYAQNVEDIEASLVGTVISLVDLGHNVEVDIELDMSTDGAKLVTRLLDGNKQLMCGLSGSGHVDERGSVMDSIEYVALYDPSGAPR